MQATAFHNHLKLASGTVHELAQTHPQATLYDDATGDIIDTPLPPRPPGRPRLGVVPREVTLLPRHWEWLNAQPGGASIALRKLVEQARRSPEEAQKQARQAAHKFMTHTLGNQPGYEEALRALYANQPDRFHQLSQPWPADLRDHTRQLAHPCWS